MNCKFLQLQQLPIYIKEVKLFLHLTILILVESILKFLGRPENYQTIPHE